MQYYLYFLYVKYEDISSSPLLRSNHTVLYDLVLHYYFILCYNTCCQYFKLKVYSNSVQQSVLKNVRKRVKPDILTAVGIHISLLGHETNAVWYIGTNISEESTASIFHQRRKQTLPECWYFSTKLQNIMFQKTVMLIRESRNQGSSSLFVLRVQWLQGDM